jgi:phenylpropionate dioxygenase-like ring-hydroxylating dioxygenase large terminal subunit
MDGTGDGTGSRDQQGAASGRAGGGEGAGPPYALTDLWYYAMPSYELGPGELLPKTILGRDLVFGREGDGAPFCLEDICPHRGIPLRFGRLDGADVECCYHGWRFAPDGCLKEIPSLTEDQEFDFSRIRVTAFPCREASGNIWVWMGAGKGPFTPDIGIPELPGGDPGPIRIFDRQIFPCPMDQAVMGLMDPAHGPFVHASWWWRPRTSAYEKAKAFAPSEYGFTMCRHRPSKNSRGYKLLGGTPETETVFRLPGIRVEEVEAGDNRVLCLTCVTPIGPDATEVNQIVYWNIPWLAPFTPFIRHYAKRFLGQDRDIVTKQQYGLAHNPPMRLIDDADLPAKWYLRLKWEFARARADGRPFENPVPRTTLRWRT